MTGLGTNVQAVQAVISFRSYLNPQGPTQQSALNYTTADGFSARALASTTITVPPSTTGQQINLASLFPAFTAPVYVYICEPQNSDGSGLGFKVTTATNGSGKMGVAINGCFAYMADGATALTSLYVDNASTTDTLVLNVGVMTL